MRLRLVVMTAVLAIGVLVVTQIAGATHVRPKGATPLYNSLVIAQQACGSPNSTHGAPLAFPSCNPPVQSSSWVTAGTPDANSAAANQVGYARLDIVPADVNIKSNITDVRCLPLTPAAVCTSTNTLDGLDYSGELELRILLRITDHNNSPSTTGTAVDIPFAVVVPCTVTPPSGTSTIGSTCNVTTSMNAQVPGMAPAGKRTVYQIPQGVPGGGIQVWDGGSTGVAGSTGATLYLEPGVFLP
jgi:hypothetical protein